MENSLIVEAVSKFVTTPVLPSITVVLVINAPPVSTLNLVSGFTQSAPTIAKVPTSSADVSFLHKGFLNPSPSAGQDCHPPVAPGFINPSYSHSEKYGVGPFSELVIREREDVDFWDEEDGEFPYFLGDFPPTTRLDWVLFGNEGIKDVIKDTPQKVKGKRELMNLECSINYDVKGASSTHGKAKAHAC
jgi:hypothetical protein